MIVFVTLITCAYLWAFTQLHGRACHLPSQVHLEAQTASIEAELGPCMGKHLSAIKGPQNSKRSTLELEALLQLLDQTRRSGADGQPLIDRLGLQAERCEAWLSQQKRELQARNQRFALFLAAGLLLSIDHADTLEAGVLIHSRPEWLAISLFTWLMAALILLFSALQQRIQPWFWHKDRLSSSGLAWLHFHTLAARGLALPPSDNKDKALQGLELMMVELQRLEMRSGYDQQELRHRLLSLWAQRRWRQDEQHQKHHQQVYAVFETLLMAGVAGACLLRMLIKHQMI